jgi:hypothetical protein
VRIPLFFAVLGVVVTSTSANSTALLAGPIDPGVRHAISDGGPPIPPPGLTQDELSFFRHGLARFVTVEVVSSLTKTGK